jgi:hypothetical protein
VIDRLPDHHESPSLLGGRLSEGDAPPPPPGFELKFLLPAEMAEAVANWALSTDGGDLRLDPHGEAALGGAYTTTTLYLDTPALDVYYRREGFARRRYRIRRYGDASWVHLERKIKSGDEVRKQRCAVPLEEAPMVAAGGGDGWGGHWFRARIGELGLRPASIVTYRRTAFVGACAEGPLRVTIDRDARSRLCTHDGEWVPDRLRDEEGADVLGGRAVVELKYLAALPLPFKTLMKNLTLHPGTVSKYRLGREVLGSPAPVAQGVPQEPPRA